MADSVTLHYVERGQGTPVVFLHGFPFDHAIWQAQVAALRDSFRLILPDLRGHGQSPVPAGVYRMELMAQDVFALLDDLNIERAVWVGHSMGGYVTMAALRAAPERIAGIGLVATHPLRDPDDRRAGRLATAENVLTEGSGMVAQNMIRMVFAPGFDLDSPPARALFDLMSRTSPLGIAGAQRGMAERPDSVETLRHTRVPAVVIAGLGDQIVDPDVMRQMARDIPHGRLVEIVDAGHMPMIEQPDATTAALREFIESISGD
ncbi:MAG TPA: alpha/beta fold hydrolase [Aggregatilineaceae bacterium]|jgi:pimeloyl-ACP methyl ester carboxylesterase|nr:alpha/beta fold hydrolase [Aggregatilineaceae bacterium]